MKQKKTKQGNFFLKLDTKNDAECTFSRTFHMIELYHTSSYEKIYRQSDLHIFLKHIYLVGTKDNKLYTLEIYQPIKTRIASRLFTL